MLDWLCGQGAQQAASRWYARLLESLTTLEHDPGRCPLADEAAELNVELRELHIGRQRGVYRVLFRVEKNTVYIVRIWHSARNRLTPDELD